MTQTLPKAKLSDVQGVTDTNAPTPLANITFPIFEADTAPRDGSEILAWWPFVQLDEDGNLTNKPVEQKPKGAWVPTRWQGGCWDEPDWFDAIGGWFGDDHCYAQNPTHWTRLPGDPAALAKAKAVQP